jgi:hypothetical protein
MQAWHLAVAASRQWQACRNRRSYFVGGAVIFAGILILSSIQNNPEAQERQQSVQNPVNEARQFDANSVVAGERSEIAEQKRNLYAFLEQEKIHDIWVMADSYGAAAGREMNNPTNPNCYGKSQVDCLDSFIQNRMNTLATLTGAEDPRFAMELRMEVEGMLLAKVMAQPPEALAPEDREYRTRMLQAFQSVENGEVKFSLDNPSVRPNLLLAMLLQIEQAERATATIEEQAGVVAEEIGQQ